MKIIDRIIKIKIRVSVIDNEGKTYFLNEKYVLLYVISLIAIIFAAIISVVVLGLPHIFEIEIQVISILAIIICLIPISIFSIIPKNKKYLEGK